LEQKGVAFNKLGKYDEAAKSFGEAMMLVDKI
jgi:hypothetical protein